VRLPLAVTLARVHESTSRAEAIDELRAVVSETTKYGMMRTAFEARLALAGMKVRAGDRALARTQLASLEKDSAALGFTLMARKARAAREAGIGERSTARR